MSTKLLFLGVDALDKDLVLHWAAAGTLPTFRRLLSTAAWGVTNSPPGLFVGAIWPSFWTSVSPGRHARYCYQQIRPGSYEKVPVRPADTGAPAFWDALSGAGKRLAIIDVPKTHVANGLNGLHIVDWGTHDPDFDGPTTWPPALAGELVAAYGPDPVGNCNVYGRQEQYVRLRDDLVARVATKRRLVADVLEREQWDCVVAVFSESHCVGHQCWHVHDPSHQRHDPDVRRRVGDPIRDVYVALDAAIGQLLDHADPATEVFILGSHGMRPHYDATFLLDAMLRRIESPGARLERPRAAPIAARAWRWMPRGVRWLLSPLRGPVKARLQAQEARLGGDDVASRRYFAVPNNDACGGVRVNLAGREPNGTVRSGADFDAMCAALERDLNAFVNMDTGKPVIRRVLRTRALYRGPFIDHLPDLMLEWNHDAPIARVFSPRTGEIAGRYTKSRTGDHSPEGIFFVAGPGVVPGRLGRDVSIVDFGPTLAQRLGVRLEDVDGRSIADAVFADGAGAPPRAS
jgi:predicted AlkP superfamily phosphohydrolase/phosphomutase